MQLAPYLIYKAAPAPEGKPCGRKGTVTYEILHDVPDKWGNKFPPTDKCIITVTRTANSSGLLTLDILDRVFLPYLGIVDGKADYTSTILVDDFRGHSDKRVKERTEPMSDVLNWEIMAGGITPKAQPLDVLINKVFKGYFRDLFEAWSLCAPINEKNGNPLPPSRQLLANWILTAWDKISPALVVKAWEVCGYKTQKQLKADAEDMGAITVWSAESLGAVVERAAGNDALTHFLHDVENLAEPEFPEDGEEEEWAGHGYQNGVARGEKKKRESGRGSGPAAGRKRLKRRRRPRPQAEDGNNSC